MRLLDTNVLIYARTKDSPFRQWATEELVDAVSGDGAFLSAVSLAELCAAAEHPETVAAEVRALGVGLLDLPAAAAARCGEAYAHYRAARRAESGKDSPVMPLADFWFIREVPVWSCEGRRV
jgi:predicted nucleic acid-binding protein